MSINAGPLQEEMVLPPATLPENTSLVDAFERQYVSQYSGPVLGLLIHVAGVLTDPDGSVVTVTVEDINGRVLFSMTATRESAGGYLVTLSSAETAVVGQYSLVWAYSVGSVPQTYTTYLEIGPAAPAYDVLDSDMQAIVESVFSRFDDAFDSVDGGPNLQTYYQAHWGRGRVARLMGVALSKLNVSAQPSMSFSLTDPGKFPVAAWGGVLEQATYIESIRHLIRSYVEQPDPQNTTVSRLDRRDYMQRWQMVLEMEEQDFIPMRDVFKISFMGLGRPGVLVSGGAYGNFAPTRFAGGLAARPNYLYRWYG
jgi:hypothetical protein